jgi:hypothetical protein
VRNLALVGVLLLAGILVGVTLQPDDGTAVHLGRQDTVVHAGANHAKPLPRIPTPADLAPMLATAVGLLTLVLTALAVRRLDRGSWHSAAEVWWHSATRRGPPVLV